MKNINAPEQRQVKIFHSRMSRFFFIVQRQKVVAAIAASFTERFE
jgi:hypothetical protein